MKLHLNWLGAMQKFQNPCKFTGPSNIYSFLKAVSCWAYKSICAGKRTYECHFLSSQALAEVFFVLQHTNNFNHLGINSAQL